MEEAERYYSDVWLLGKNVTKLYPCFTKDWLSRYGCYLVRTRVEIWDEEENCRTTAYSATKAYQINYMEALRKKAFNSDSHIKITDIRPGLVDTAMAKGEGLFWVVSVEKVAGQIIAAIRKKKSKAYVTKRWHILAIISRNLPFLLYKRMYDVY